MFVVIIVAVIVVLFLQLATLVDVNIVTFDPTAIIGDDIEADAVLRRSKIVPSVIIPILLRKRPKKCRASSSTSAQFSGWLLCFFVRLFLPQCILVSLYFVASLDGQSNQHHPYRITSTKSSHPPPTMFGWLLHIANKQPPLDAPYHTLGGRVPITIHVDNHLMEGDVISP